MSSGSSVIMFNMTMFNECYDRKYSKLRMTGIDNSKYLIFLHYGYWIVLVDHEKMLLFCSIFQL